MAVKKERQSNFELLRIIAMLLILAVHANYMSFDLPTFDNVFSSWCRVLLENMCIIGTSLFTLKSGWFGIKPKPAKFLVLAIQVATYVLAINIFVAAAGLQPLSMGLITDVIVVGRGYWFIVSYLLLFILSPIINTFIEHSSQSRFKWTLITFYCFQFIYGWWYNAEFGHGHSALSFMGLYMLARYFRLYGNPLFKLKTWTLLSLFVIVAACVSLQETLFYTLGGEDLGVRTLYFHLRTNSPFTILETTLIFTIISKIQFSSRAVNYVASSSLAVYLIHVNPYIFDYYTAAIRHIYEYTPNAWGLIGIIAFIIVVFFASIAIDKMRMALIPTERIADALDNSLARITHYRNNAEQNASKN